MKINMSYEVLPQVPTLWKWIHGSSGSWFSQVAGYYELSCIITLRLPEETNPRSTPWLMAMADTEPPCKCHTHISLFMSTQNLCHTYNVRDFRSEKLEEEDDHEEKETPPLKKREKPKKLKSKTEIHCQECIILAVLKLSIPNAWKGSDSVLQTISEDANEVGEFYHLGSSALPSFCELGESLQTSPDDQYGLPEDKSDMVTLPPLHLHSVMIPPPYSQLSLSLS